MNNIHLESLIILLNKLGIYTVEDLLLFFPFRYDVFKRSNIYELEQDDKIIIDKI